MTQLELVDNEGRQIGVSEKLATHREGRLHRAFSVFLFTSDHRLIVQRRAFTKYHSPGVWSNSCCGHPPPGEAPFTAAARRTFEELGAYPRMLCEADCVTYRLHDPSTGLIEHEYNHVFVGLVPNDLNPDPGEVSAMRACTAADLETSRQTESWSMWFGTVADVAFPAAHEWDLWKERAS